MCYTPTEVRILVQEKTTVRSSGPIRNRRNQMKQKRKVSMGVGLEEWETKLSKSVVIYFYL
jgi:hypothetical protein